MFYNTKWAIKHFVFFLFCFVYIHFCGSHTQKIILNTHRNEWRVRPKKMRQTDTANTALNLLKLCVVNKKKRIKTISLENAFNDILPLLLLFVLHKLIHSVLMNRWKLGFPRGTIMKKKIVKQLTPYIASFSLIRMLMIQLE